ncbi:hypothetical protein G6F50_015510 [Rhizopus delemar]|uniref:Uncharacterized protein n=1 Tax=Rhizopus delemar TaxID=936053 RepID=A0A9P6XXC7_9FUNG|nr:hypothetical protein G6F50_015510 [Rhizopus delemar]
MDAGTVKEKFPLRVPGPISCLGSEVDILLLCALPKLACSLLGHIQSQESIRPIRKVSCIYTYWLISKIRALKMRILRDDQPRTLICHLYAPIFVIERTERCDLTARRAGLLNRCQLTRRIDAGFGEALHQSAWTPAFSIPQHGRSAALGQ